METLYDGVPLTKKTPILYYDQSCPVCIQFKKHIEKKAKNPLEFRDIGSQAKKFKYVDSDSLIHVGKVGLRRLITDYPEVTSALQILPESWRFVVSNKILEMAGLLRDVNKKISKKSGGCGCGK